MLVFAAGVLAVIAGVLPHAAGGSARLTDSLAYDVSYPQCEARLPGAGSTGLVGVTAGRPFTVNPCLKSQYEWAAGRAQPPQLYMNTSNPQAASAYWTSLAGSGPRDCAAAGLADPGNLDCAYNFGWNVARDGFGRALKVLGGAAVTHAWWLDVETANSWDGTAAANAQDVQGGIDFLRSVNVPATGIYSTSHQWGEITGGYQVPGEQTSAPGNWVAGASSADEAHRWCAPASSFSGGTVRLVQYLAGTFDGNAIC